MRRIMIGILAALLIWTGIAAAAEAVSGSEGKTAPVTETEMEALAAQVRQLADASSALNDPALEEAQAEDGILFQYEFGALYADRTAWTAETKIHAMQIMDAEIAGPRGIAVDWTVNQVMAAVPCENMEMNGVRDKAALYLEGDPEQGFAYGRVERDGQRISAIEYGVWNPEKGWKTALTLGISGDGVESMRLERQEEEFTPEDARILYEELETLSHRYAYYRVPRSQNGTDLEMFHEGDLDFSVLSFRTAQPENMGENVEDMIMEDDGGSWIRRIDGDGFEAVFVSEAEGREASLVSYTILSPDLEGPRYVRLGDMFHEDYTRFRHGEGEMTEDGREVLYGEVGKAPWGMAEYGDGTEMTLRYVTPTLGGPDVELILRYRNTVLTEIVLHTLEEDEGNAD